MRCILFINKDDILIADFEIPKHWKRSYGMDVGWKSTAVVWGALDPETNSIYVYAEYKRGNVEPYTYLVYVRRENYGYTRS